MSVYVCYSTIQGIKENLKCTLFSELYSIDPMIKQDESQP